VFSNGKFRVISHIDELEASFMPFAYLQKIRRRPMNKFPLITLQSYTLKCNLGFKVDLPKLSAALLTAEVPYVYEPELFPAHILKQYKPIIFSTGTVMVCGIKNYDEMYTILPQLKQLCQPYRR
jgi:TATA-box binding protein (TBP) (component of TFIID and TFIIIB)